MQVTRAKESKGGPGWEGPRRIWRKWCCSILEERTEFTLMMRESRKSCLEREESMLEALDSGQAGAFESLQENHEGWMKKASRGMGRMCRPSQCKAEWLQGPESDKLCMSAKLFGFGFVLQAGIGEAYSLEIFWGGGAIGLIIMVDLSFLKAVVNRTRAAKGSSSPASFGGKRLKQFWWASIGEWNS